MLKNISRPHSEIFFLILSRKQTLTFHVKFAWNIKIYFLKNNLETIYMECQSLFSGKKKRKIHFIVLSAKFATILDLDEIYSISEHRYLFCFVLRFYGPVNLMGLCRARSVYLTTLLWAGLVLKAVNQYCAHSFARNWQLPFLNQWKGENDHRKYFIINLHKRMLPTRWELNPQHPDHQSDRHPSEPLRQAWTQVTVLFICILCIPQMSCVFNMISRPFKIASWYDFRAFDECPLSHIATHLYKL